jgi:hypothetical protein
MVDAETYENVGYGPVRWAKKAYLEGYDSVILEDIIDGDTSSTVTCVFDPARIKILDFKVYSDED